MAALLAFSFFFTICLLSSSSSSAVYAPYGKPIRLTSLQSLTFLQGKETTHRRSSSIPQLSCRKGCHLYDPDEIWCRNTQSINNNVLWQCEANLPSGVSLKDPEVNCEGYDSEEDENILEGSCGLKFSLVQTGSHQRSGYQQLVLWATVFIASVFVYITWSGRGIQF